MTEQDLWAQAAKLKEIYANNLNTQKQNSVNEMNSSKQAFTTDANNQLKQQDETTGTARVDADISSNNNARILRELAARNGFSNGGELLTGMLNTNQEKSNKINSLNRSFADYRKNWDNKLNEYNNSFNNKLNTLNSETANKINEYNVNTDYDFKGKIEQLRAQQAAEAAAAAKARTASASRSSSSGTKSSGTSGMTKTELYDYRLRQLNDYMSNNKGYRYLTDNKENLLNELGQTSYDKLYNYWHEKSSNVDSTTAMRDINDEKSRSQMSASMFRPIDEPEPAKPVDTKNSWFNMLSNLFVK